MEEKVKKNKALYFVYVINDFAEYHNISEQSAFNYLQRYKGIEFIDKHYEAEHLLSMENAIEDLTKICNINGGGLVC